MDFFPPSIKLQNKAECKPIHRKKKIKREKKIIINSDKVKTLAVIRFHMDTLGAFFPLLFKKQNKKTAQYFLVL